MSTAWLMRYSGSPVGPYATELEIHAKRMSPFGAPIVFDTYPFDRLKSKVALMVIHGDQDTTNPIEASKKMADAAKGAGVETVYATVPGGTHLEAYLTYASQIFDFLDSHRK